MFTKIFFVNLLTVLRIIGTIFLIPVYKKYGAIKAVLLSVGCYITDLLDGILARRLQASTFFGALLDGAADKLLTLINFIILFFITPYAIIPIIFEFFIVLVQTYKYFNNYNVQSNAIGKLKVWILAITIMFVFLVSDINNLSFIPVHIQKYILSINDYYFWILLPALVIELIALVSYILEIIYVDNKKYNVVVAKSDSEGNHFWLDPDFYSLHKDDANLKELRKSNKKSS